MCGICGRLEFDSEKRVSPALLQGMMQAISHRGPDGHGLHAVGPVGLGHTRLAIIDLNTGAQPIANEDQSIWVVYNGEIYNFHELRSELLEKGHRFLSTTDTEVIVHLYEEYGKDCLSRMRGMFAFALWDDKQKVLLLARDRVGIKPLYYSVTANAIVFASEIKALLTDPEIRCQVEAQSIDKFLTHFCLPGRETLWKGINKLEPGSYLQVHKGAIQQQSYWDLQFRRDDRWKNIDEAAEEVYRRIRSAVKDHMISDVPLGFLLSGGLDSTAVLSCAASEASNPLSTFTVGFEGASFEDERPYAKLASERFGTQHHEITVTATEFWDFLPCLMRYMEEPICDPPAASLHFISRLARRHVTVLLSGEGGDEAFGGYNDYRNFLLLEKFKSFAPPLNQIFGAGLRAAGRFAPLRKIAKFSPFLLSNPKEYYYSRVANPFSYFNRNKEELYTSDLLASISVDASTEVTRALFGRVADRPVLDQMQYMDTKTSLPDDLLVKADRMTMLNSLELRVPFLDHHILEFAASLSGDFRVKGSTTKRILRRAFRNRIPREIINRRKAGFPIPIEQWLQRELKTQVRDVLLSETALKRGYFRKSGIEKLLLQAERGFPVGKEIFSLLTLELLLREFLDSREGRPVDFPS